MRRQHYDNGSIFDERGCLKDGRTYRVRTTLMDSQQRDVALNRPGFRTADATQGARRQRAYDAYHDDLESAWRTPPTGAGERGPRGAQPGDLCTVAGPEFLNDFGSPGQMQMYGGKLVCVPDSPVGDAAKVTRRDPGGRLEGTFEEEEDRDDEDEELERCTSDARRDSRAVKQMMADHAQKMDQLYDQRDRELCDAWRGAK